MATVWENVSLKEREELRGMTFADCVVIGGGLVGIMTAYRLQQRGLSAVVLEADRVASGATARTTAKITSQHGIIYSKIARKIGKDYAKLYYESNQEAIDDFEEIIRREKIDCDFRRVSAYLYSRKSSLPLLKEQMYATISGAKCTCLRDTELPFSVKCALKFENQAQFHPLKFIKPLTRNLEIYEKSPVVSVEDNMVYTAKGMVKTHYIINTCHYPFINSPGYYFLRQHQERSYLLAVNTEKQIDGMYLDVDSGHTLRNFTGGMLIGGEKHRTGKNKKGGCYCRLEDFANELFKDAEVTHAWSNQDAITHDGLPFIGRFSKKHPDMFVATGFNKWGMSLSSVASTLIADLICSKYSEYESLYTPQRMNIRAGAGEFLKDAGCSAVYLFSGLLSKKERKCTHLGCRLQKNSDENTWECPCHGSQFDKGGKINFSPAKRDKD